MTSRRFVNAFRTVINEHSKEGDSNTPDFVLARFLAQSLEAFDLAITHRDDWYAVDEHQEKLDAYERKCGELQTSIDSLVAVNAGFGKRVRDLDEELGAMIRKCNAGASTNDTLRGEITVLKREFEATTSSYRTIQGLVKDLREENETLRGEIHALTTK